MVFEAKLTQLRQPIQAGLDSGPAEPWDSEQIKRTGHARRAAKLRRPQAFNTIAPSST